MEKLTPVSSVAEEDLTGVNPGDTAKIGKYLHYVNVKSEDKDTIREEPQEAITITEISDGDDTNAEMNDEENQAFAGEFDSVRSGESLFKIFSFDNKSSTDNTEKCLEFWRALNKLGNVQPCKCSKLEDQKQHKNVCAKRESKYEGKEACHCFLDILKLMQAHRMDVSAFAAKNNNCKLCDYETPYSDFKKKVRGHSEDELQDKSNLADLNEWKSFKKSEIEKKELKKVSDKKKEPAIKDQDAPNLGTTYDLPSERQRKSLFCTCGKTRCDCLPTVPHSTVSNQDVQKAGLSMDLLHRQHSSQSKLQIKNYSLVDFDNSPLPSKKEINRAKSDFIVGGRQTQIKSVVRCKKSDIPELPLEGYPCERSLLMGCTCDICRDKSPVRFDIVKCDKCGLPQCDCQTRQSVKSSDSEEHFALSTLPEEPKCTICVGECKCWNSLVKDAKFFLDGFRDVMNPRILVSKRCGTEDEEDEKVHKNRTIKSGEYYFGSVCPICQQTDCDCLPSPDEWPLYTDEEKEQFEIKKKTKEKVAKKETARKATDQKTEDKITKKKDATTSVKRDIKDEIRERRARKMMLLKEPKYSVYPSQKTKKEIRDVSRNIVVKVGKHGLAQIVRYRDRRPPPEPVESDDAVSEEEEQEEEEEEHRKYRDWSYRDRIQAYWAGKNK